MSPRGKRIRKLLNPPVIKGFKPFGLTDGVTASEEIVVMLYEEYESIKLCDYDMLNHHAASEMMGVSRPTFTRIYSSARQKVAMALAEGRQLRIEGGKVCFDSDWFKCKECSSYFNNPDKESKPESCPLCGSKDIEIENSALSDISSCSDFSDNCVCPKCGHVELHNHGLACRLQVCPHCNTTMRRGN